ncbi:hypothetical protein V2J97_16805 [Pseudomonas alliivorans]|nr:hypothetical protein [Pseudomonas alliivorans]
MIFDSLAIFATYRDIYDALMSSKQKVSQDYLLNFLAERGYVLSPFSTREELIDYVSGLTLGSSDFNELFDQLEVSSRAEKTANTKMLTKALSLDEKLLLRAVKALRELRKHKNETISVVADNGRLLVNVLYQDLDHGRTVLRQRRNRNVNIEIFKDQYGYTFRRPANPRMDEICSQLIAELQKYDKTPLRIEKIDLNRFSREKRTLFFNTLINSVPKYSFHDLIRVGVSQPTFVVDFIGGSGADFDEDDEVDEGTSEQAAQVAAQVRSFLKKAALDGTGVLHSKELKQFLESGFFIARVVWQAIENTSTGQKVEFEALIAKPASGEDFRYSVKGVYPRKKDGSFVIVRQKPKDEDVGSLLALIEKAAKIAINTTERTVV